jgi:hypothetical protein
MVFHSTSRVQIGTGILKNHRRTHAAHLSPILIAQRRNIRAVQQNLTTYGSFLQYTEGGANQRRFPGATFTNDGKYLTGAHGKGYIAYGLFRTV